MNLPEDFIREARQTMGRERFDRFIGSFGEEPPVSIRLNPAKCGMEAAGGPDAPARGCMVPAEGGQPVPWCATGHYLDGRPAFTFDPLFHAGCYYVQEASSMFVSHVVGSLLEGYFPRTAMPMAVLDLCAAPGGKSTAMRSVLPGGSLLVSNEPMGLRAQILLENITKWGWPDCIVTNSYPRDFRRSGAQFDLILCDVPCSGEGMFRKDEGAVGEWSVQNVEKCWRLQREIVAEAWECLRPGGILIYSTCTYNTKENEENVRWIGETYGAEPLSVPTRPEWGITGSLLAGFEAPVYRFIPGLTRGEGLFMAVLRKPGDPGAVAADPRRTIAKRLKVVSLEQDAENSAGPAKRQPRSTQDKDDAVPTIPYAELSYPDALRYLRGEALTLPPDQPRGLVTVGYRHIPLGRVKNVGNRANNLYPKAWRIKTTHLPTEYTNILRIE